MTADEDDYEGLYRQSRDHLLSALAHDNPLLGYDESRLIFNQVCSTIRYIRALEDGEPDEETGNEDDIPF